MLENKDFCDAASALGCEVAAVQAVTDVESHGSGFLDDGSNRPVILFESHTFHRLTQGQYDADHPDVSTRTWVHNYGAAGAHQYERLNEALELDRTAALKSASWGMFQIMGENYQLCGFDKVEDFVSAMYTGEAAHLAAFVQFCKGQELDALLKAKNWAAFAARYNGPGFRQNGYHIKLAAAYAKHAGEIDCEQTTT